MKPGRRQFAAHLLTHPADFGLATRTAGWMTSVPLLKRVLPLPRLVRLMSRRADGRPRDSAREREVAELVSRLCRVSGGNCLNRSLILYRYLGRMNAAPELVVGFGKEERIVGHVWVVVDGESLLETPQTLAPFGVVISFDSSGRRSA